HHRNELRRLNLAIERTRSEPDDSAGGGQNAHDFDQRRAERLDPGEFELLLEHAALQPPHALALLALARVALDRVDALKRLIQAAEHHAIALKQLHGGFAHLAAEIPEQDDRRRNDG